jgi:membrane protein required for colicin V production
MDKYFRECTIGQRGCPKIIAAETVLLAGWRGWRSTTPSDREPGSAIASAALFLGAVWIGLVAITLVLIFDRLVPADRQPAFPVGSHLRPLLSTAGQKGFSSLPPDVAATIDRLKQAQRI